jgi:WD40 repeat protein
MQFSPQRDRVLTFNEDDQSARLWDATSGASLCEPLRHGPQSTWVNGYYIAGFNPQGNIVLTMGGDSKARLWDAYTGEDLGILFQGLDIPTKAAFSTQGDRVVTLSPEAARIWEVNSNEPFMKTPPNDIVDAVAFAPGGDYVLTGMRYGGARIWDAKTGALLQTLQHEGSVHVAAFSPQGDRVLIGGASLTRLWNAKTGEPLGEPLPHIGTVSSLGFSPQGDRVITGCSGQYGVTPDEGFARLWDATTGAPLCEPLLHESDVSAVAFNPQGDRVLSMSREGASLWDAKPGVPLGKPLKHKGVVAFAFTPHGYRMVIRNADGSGEVRDSTVDAPTGIALREVKFEQAAFSPQGDRLLTSGNDVRLWDARTGERLGVPIILDTPFLAVAFSPDGDRLLTAGQDYYARLWNVRTGSLLGEPMRHKSAVLAAAFSPRGDCVVTSDFTARLWNARTLTAPQHESNYFELHTGHEVDSDGQSRAVNATEWELKRRDFLRDNEAWMKEQVAHADSRQRQYHQSCLRRALTARDTFVATFHHSWLKKLGLDTSALDEKLEQLRTEQPASKPVW